MPSATGTLGWGESLAHGEVSTARLVGARTARATQILGGTLSGLARLLFGIAAFALLVLLANAIASAAWLWLLLAAVVALVLYRRTGLYGLLLLGALLVGASVGILLEVALRWSGAFLVSVGTAAVATEAAEERPGRWAAIFGLAFIGLGMLVGIFDAGRWAVLATALLVAAGLVWWQRTRKR